MASLALGEGLPTKYYPDILLLNASSMEFILFVDETNIKFGTSLIPPITDNKTAKASILPAPDLSSLFGAKPSISSIDTQHNRYGTYLALFTMSIISFSVYPTKDLVNSPELIGLHIGVRPIIEGSVSVNVVFPVPGGPYNNIPLDSDIDLL